MFFFSDGVHYFDFDGSGLDVNFVDLGPDGVAALGSLAAKGVQIFSFSVGDVFDDQVISARGRDGGQRLRRRHRAPGHGRRHRRHLHRGGRPRRCDGRPRRDPVRRHRLRRPQRQRHVFEITNIDEFGNWSILIPGGILHEGVNPIQAFVFADGGAAFAEDFTHVIALDDDLVVVQDFD